MVKALGGEFSSIDKSHLLVVEGKDDALFFKALLMELNITDIEIWPIGGKDCFKRTLRSFVKLSGFEKIKSIGVIRDADDNPIDAFKSVKNALRENGLPAPESYGCRSASTPVINILILPDGITGKGMLESLCLRAIKDDPAMLCTDKYFECLLDHDIYQREVDEDKARVHVYLASKNRSDERLGESALSGCWPFDNEAFDNVKQFLLDVGNI